MDCAHAVSTRLGLDRSPSRAGSVAVSRILARRRTPLLRECDPLTWVAIRASQRSVHLLRAPLVSTSVGARWWNGLSAVSAA